MSHNPRTTVKRAGSTEPVQTSATIVGAPRHIRTTRSHSRQYVRGCFRESRNFPRIDVVCVDGCGGPDIKTALGKCSKFSFKRALTTSNALHSQHQLQTGRSATKKTNKMTSRVHYQLVEAVWQRQRPVVLSRTLHGLTRTFYEFLAVRSVASHPTILGCC
jgi:hypothetical protein